MTPEDELPAGWQMIDFVGGPLDGPNQVHMMMNSILNIPGGEYDGYYRYLPMTGKYHWVEPGI